MSATAFAIRPALTLRVNALDKRRHNKGQDDHEPFS